MDNETDDDETFDWEAVKRQWTEEVPKYLEEQGMSPMGARCVTGCFFIAVCLFGAGFLLLTVVWLFTCS